MKTLQNMPLRRRKLDIHFSIPKVAALINLYFLLTSWRIICSVLINFFHFFGDDFLYKWLNNSIKGAVFVLCNFRSYYLKKKIILLINQPHNQWDRLLRTLVNFLYDSQ